MSEALEKGATPYKPAHVRKAERAQEEEAEGELLLLITSVILVYGVATISGGLTIWVVACEFLLLHH